MRVIRVAVVVGMGVRFGMGMRVRVVVGMVVVMMLVVAIAVVMVVAALAMGVIVVMMVMGGLGALEPKRDGTNQRESQQHEAAGHDEGVELLAEHESEHLRPPEIKGEADHPERTGDADHAELVSEIGVVVVMMVMGHESAPFLSDHFVVVGIGV
jgi:hypothetical protein